MSIFEMKTRRKDEFAKIRAAFDALAYESRDRASHRNLLRRLAEALYSVGREDIYKKIENCSSGRRCGSLWCKICRNNASRYASEKLLARVQEKNYSNDDLLHLTAPVGLAMCEANDVKRVLHQDSLRWKRIRKRNKFWIEAIYEFELVNFRYLMGSNGSELKKIQMTQLVESSKMKANEFIFVHWHGVTDVKRDQIKDIFGEEYFIDSKPLYKTMDSGLYIQGFHNDKSIEQNILKVGSYPLKNALRFKHTFKGSDYSNGEYFTLEELGMLIALYDDVQGRQWRGLRRYNGKHSS